MANSSPASTLELPGARPVAERPLEVRAAFIQRTYLHLFGAILGFTAVEAVLFSTGLAQPIARALLGTSWLVVIGGLVLVSWLAARVAHQARSPRIQYAALVGSVVAQALLSVPLLLLAQLAVPGAIESGSLVTLLGFTGLTIVVFSTGSHFSFRAGLLRFAAVLGLSSIAAGLLFGFELGTFVPVAMVAFAGGVILHDTPNVLHHPEDRHVGAALELFASVTLMFWYVLWLLLWREN